MSERTQPTLLARLFIYLVVFLMLVGGLGLFGGGAYLAYLGGSWYFVLAGLGLIVSGILMAMRRAAGAWLFGLVFVGTIIWAVWEVGFAFWPLVSRLFAPGVLAVLVLLAAPALRAGRGRIAAMPAFGLAALVAVGLAGTVWNAFQLRPLVAPDQSFDATAAAAEAPREWRHYGNSPAGTRYAPFDEITPDNVADLEVAWTFRTGDVPINESGTGAEDQNTPIQVGDTIYACTVTNIVYALDADTGEEIWQFDPEASSPMWQRCRGVGYYESTGEAAAPQPEAADGETPEETAEAEAADAQASEEATGETPATEPETTDTAEAAADEQCARRIVLTTIDARLFELDAETGTPCPSFGENGVVDLKAGMGEVQPGFYFQTSAPTVTSGLIIIGGWVVDNVMTNEPSGVVRAFSAETGELVWAWDLGNPDITTLPPEGETYTRGTPNVWSTPAFDEELGLIYLPTGNATPDFFGGHRTEAAEQYSSSIVALDIETGREEWSFQTVHHDLWDYDVPSQPALFDMPDGEGGTVPALIQTTKRGQIFVLDRRTGEPLTEVVEREVPQGGVEEDWTSPTQPYSVGMPQIGAEPLTEADMWGATPFDQLYCRIAFRQMRYEGDFTPPGLTPSLQWPGYFGGMNWGSSSIHEPSGLLVVNDTRSPQRVQLVPREVADAADADQSHEGLSSQYGTPYGAAKVTFLSPLGVPCPRPPYGTLTAIDLESKQIVWQIPMGTVEDTGPLGIKMRMPIPVGMPTVGGPFTTASGLAFYAGTLDYNIRAIDLATGEVVWKHRLPVGAQGTPMTYVSPETGRQYVVVSAGGARQSSDRGDYIIAFALPEQEE